MIIAISKNGTGVCWLLNLYRSFIVFEVTNVIMFVLDQNLPRSLQRYTKTSKMAFILHVTGGCTTLIPTNCTTVTRVHHSMPVNYKPKNEPGAHTRREKRQKKRFPDTYQTCTPPQAYIWKPSELSKYNSWHKHLSHIASLLPNIILSWP